MKPWLYVGAKVVCVDDARDPTETQATIEGRPNMPVAGETYTVRAVAATDPRTNMRSPCEVWLVEIVNPVAVWSTGIEECGFGSSRFRPLHDNSKTIEEMRSLMLDATVRGKVSA